MKRRLDEVTRALTKPQERKMARRFSCDGVPGHVEAHTDVPYMKMRLDSKGTYQKCPLCQVCWDLREGMYRCSGDGQDQPVHFVVNKDDMRKSKVRKCGVRRYCNSCARNMQRQETQGKIAKRRQPKSFICAGVPDHVDCHAVVIGVNVHHNKKEKVCQGCTNVRETMFRCAGNGQAQTVHYVINEDDMCKNMSSKSGIGSTCLTCAKQRMRVVKNHSQEGVTLRVKYSNMGVSSVRRHASIVKKAKAAKQPIPAAPTVMERKVFDKMVHDTKNIYEIKDTDGTIVARFPMTTTGGYFHTVSPDRIDDSNLNYVPENVIIRPSCLNSLRGFKHDVFPKFLKTRYEPMPDDLLQRNIYAARTERTTQIENKKLKQRLYQMVKNAKMSITKEGRKQFWRKLTFELGDEGKTDDLTGIQLDADAADRSPIMPSIERKNANIGYTRDNVVLICVGTNSCTNGQLREDMSKDEMDEAVRDGSFNVDWFNSSTFCDFDKVLEVASADLERIRSISLTT
jgi:hypothetical protein